MKKTIIIAFCLLILTSCSGITYEERTETKIKNEELGLDMTVSGNVSETPELSDEELSFYNNIIEALKNADLGEKGAMPNVTESDIIKQIDGEKNTVLFIKEKCDNKEKNDQVSILLLRRKSNGNNTLYSDPLSKRKATWADYKMALDRYYSQDHETSLKKMVAFHLSGGIIGKYNLDENGGFVHWGITNDKRIYNLTIDGIAPTEIIEHEMDGEKIYLWYYRHLDIDYYNMDKLDIKY